MGTVSPRRAGHRRGPVFPPPPAAVPVRPGLQHPDPRQRGPAPARLPQRGGAVVLSPRFQPRRPTQAARRGPPVRGPALLRPPWHRPAGAGPRPVPERRGRAGPQRRQHPHHAGGAADAPQAPHLVQQGPGNPAGAQDRAAHPQGGDPAPLPRPRPLRRQHRRLPGGLPQVLPQAARGADLERGGDPGGAAERPGARLSNCGPAAPGAKAKPFARRPAASRVFRRRDPAPGGGRTGAGAGLSVAGDGAPPVAGAGERPPGPHRPNHPGRRPAAGPRSPGRTAPALPRPPRHRQRRRPAGRDRQRESEGLGRLAGLLRSGAPGTGRRRGRAALFRLAAQALSLRPEHGRGPGPSRDPGQGRPHLLSRLLSPQRRRELRRPGAGRRGPGPFPQRPGGAPPRGATACSISTASFRMPASPPWCALPTTTACR